jgi:hypothetical protein
MKCRSEGKVFFFKGTQELKTVYFNTQGASANPGDRSPQANGDCAYMYFIKDGGFYYFPRFNQKPQPYCVKSNHKQFSQVLKIRFD